MGVSLAAEWLFQQIFGVQSSSTLARGSILADAARAGAAAFASTAAIPIVGPPAAPAAAAAAYAGTAAYQAFVPSFAVGAWDVPRDTLANIHEGESVLSKRDADDYRNYRSGGGMGGNITINAVDAKSVERLLSGNGGILAKEMARQVRQFNPSTKRK
jgi:hypothetical protein